MIQQMKKKKNQATTKTTKHDPGNTRKQQFADHLSEIRRRLFFVAIVFIVASAGAYPFYHHIMNAILEPLHGRELVYLTPIGGFSFIIKVCTYVGIVFAIPVLIYQIYKFLHPVIGHRSIGARKFFIASMALALVGVAFAYFILIPTALRFLTTLDIQQVSAMLTVESYLNFVIAYFIAAALMFQLPIILLLFNNITKIKPKTLMKYQRHVFLGAFVLAAVLSPTPDVINQSIMAAPIVVMYQFAIVLILIANRKKVVKLIEQPHLSVISSGSALETPPHSVYKQPVIPQQSMVHQSTKKPNLQSRPRMLSSDGFIHRKTPAPIVNRHVVSQPVVRRPLHYRYKSSTTQPIRVSMRAIDGFVSS